MIKFTKRNFTNPFKSLQSRQLLNNVSHQKLIQSDDQDFQKIFDSQKPGVYIGFDPTAESIHLGNYMGLLALTHFRLAGFQPIVLFGGATGLIGDPSGRSEERNLLSEEQVNLNIKAFQEQFEYLNQNISQKLPKFENDIIYVNNYDFYKDMSAIGFLRDVGKHFRLGNMLSKDSVKSRMTEEGDNHADGMSFTEFSYQIFQGYDFLKLSQDYNCKVQLGGSDQWGNIVSGTDLIRRVTQGASEVYGATIPLLVDSQGNKFGKSTGQAIWLDPKKTSPYELYQFLLNITDADVEQLLFKTTFLETHHIQHVLKDHKLKPEKRAAQKLLAETLTELIHGEKAVKLAQNSTQAFFTFDFESLDSISQLHFEKHFDGIQAVSLNEFSDFSSLITQVELRKSKADVRRVIAQNGVQINGKVLQENRSIDIESDFIFGKYMIIKCGKKQFKLIKNQ